MIVPDINLLLCAHVEAAPLHPAARHWWESLTNGTERVGVPWVVAMGFVRLATHASVLAHPRSPAEAVDYVDEWFRLPHVTPLNPGRQHLTLVRHALGGNLVTAAGVPGRQLLPRHRRPCSSPHPLAMEYQAEVHSNVLQPQRPGDGRRALRQRLQPLPRAGTLA